MKFFVTNFLNKTLGHILAISVFALGLWLVVIQPMGPGFRLVPGDLGDARFNNFILEHFFRWIIEISKENWGQFLSPESSIQFIGKLYGNYWNGTFFYPYRMTMAFSDNLLGSAPFYAFFRFIGLEMMGAFQAWNILGFVLNFWAATYVLDRLKLTQLAVSGGAFFFAFGLPMLAQDTHPQLIYRFCIPLACYSLFELSQKPTLKALISLLFWSIWQFYLAIYLGMFLTLMLFVICLLLPVIQPELSFREWLFYWPRIFAQLWRTANLAQRALTFLGIFTLLLALLALLWPYYWVSKSYGAFRPWDEISTMLPRLESYLLADRSSIWSTIGPRFSVPMQHEQQLFSGIAVSIMFLLGLIWITKVQNRLFALLNLGALLLLVILTLYFKEFSFYKFIFSWPGFNGLRAISRIQLVLMWPEAVLTASALDLIIQKPGWLLNKLLPYLLVSLMIVESTLFQHVTFSKSDAQARLDRINKNIPAIVPENPILIINGNQDPAYMTEIDDMLVAQELGWPILNGYSGITPHGFGGTQFCSAFPKRILFYIDDVNMRAISKKTKDFYLGIAHRVVPIGFQDCQSSWWVEMPAYKDLP